MTTTRLQFKQADEVISSVSRRTVNRYLRYWKTLEPKDYRAYYERWLFAFMSVRTQWKRNVQLFEAVRNLPDSFTRQYLRQLLVREGAGMIHVRAKGIWSFHHSFWKDPTEWYPRPGEAMTACRDRLVAQTYGLGITKVSFVLEMAFPETWQVLCADTHILRLYGASAVSDKQYRRIEEHWVSNCKKRDLPSAITRHIYWDQVQGQSSTGYWSHVFESKEAA